MHTFLYRWLFSQSVHVSLLMHQNIHNYQYGPLNTPSNVFFIEPKNILANLGDSWFSFYSPGFNSQLNSQFFHIFTYFCPFLSNSNLFLTMYSMYNCRNTWDESHRLGGGVLPDQGRGKRIQNLKWLIELKLMNIS